MEINQSRMEMLMTKSGMMRNGTIWPEPDITPWAETDKDFS